LAGFSLVTGATRNTYFKSIPTTLGAFFEYGNGSYDTFNSFANSASVRGNGNLHHYGGGLLARLEFGHNYYADGSFRIGGITNDYRNTDLQVMGQAAKYDASSTYYGLHLGGGKVYNFSNRRSLDLYGKYFWTGQHGDSVTLSTGDPIDFCSTNSHRLRLGGRMTQNVFGRLSPYFGAAWEHEFDGTASATTNGFAIDAPTLRGSTGIGELGFALTPVSHRGLFIDLGVQGYLGQREGVAASLSVGRRF
jgi:outer membrane autotransporter protein